MSKHIDEAMGRLTGSFPLGNDRRVDCMIVRDAIQASQKRERATWKAMAPMCCKQGIRYCGLTAKLCTWRNCPCMKGSGK